VAERLTCGTPQSIIELRNRSHQMAETYERLYDAVVRPFPSRPVFTPVERAQAIVDTASFLAASIMEVLGVPSNTQHVKVELDKIVELSKYMVYAAEEAALPPKVPSSS